MQASPEDDIWPSQSEHHRPSERNMSKFVSSLTYVCASMLLLAFELPLAHAERKTTYFHTDALGSIVAASDENGAL